MIALTSNVLQPDFNAVSLFQAGVRFFALPESAQHDALTNDALGLLRCVVLPGVEHTVHFDDDFHQLGTLRNDLPGHGSMKAPELFRKDRVIAGLERSDFPQQLTRERQPRAAIMSRFTLQRLAFLHQQQDIQPLTEDSVHFDVPANQTLRLFGFAIPPDPRHGIDVDNKRALLNVLLYQTSHDHAVETQSDSWQLIRGLLRDRRSLRLLLRTLFFSTSR